MNRSPYRYLGTQAFPRALPDLASLVDELGGSRVLATVAAALDVQPRTLRRWISTGRAPHAHRLALFLCTRAALSEREARAETSAQMHAGLYECAVRDLRAAHQLIERLSPLARAGAANDPLAPDYRPCGPNSRTAQYMAHERQPGTPSARMASRMTSAAPRAVAQPQLSR